MTETFTLIEPRYALIDNTISTHIYNIQNIQPHGGFYEQLLLLLS